MNLISTPLGGFPCATAPGLAAMRFGARTGRANIIAGLFILIFASPSPRRDSPHTVQVFGAPGLRGDRTRETQRKDRGVVTGAIAVSRW